jgi:LytB protein
VQRAHHEQGGRSGVCFLQGDTQKIGKMLESAMMQKVGPAALKQHFMIMDTICDATQERQDAVYDMVGKQDQVQHRATSMPSSAYMLQLTSKMSPGCWLGTYPAYC